MRLKGGLTAILLVTAIGAASVTYAQQAQLQLPPQLAWTKLCRTITVAATVAAKAQAQGQTETKQDVTVCRTFLERLNPNSGRLLVAAGIGQRSDTPTVTLRVTVPLGVDLKSGMQAKIDSGKPFKLTYANCGPGGCTADVELTAETIKALKSGQQLLLQAKGTRGNPINVALPLAGLAAVYDGSPGDGKAYVERRQQLVNAIRARRAAQIGKALQALQQQQAQQPAQVQPQPPAGSPPLEVVPQGTQP